MPQPSVHGTTVPHSVLILCFLVTNCLVALQVPWRLTRCLGGSRSCCPQLWEQAAFPIKMHSLLMNLVLWSFKYPGSKAFFLLSPIWEEASCIPCSSLSMKAVPSTNSGHLSTCQSRFLSSGHCTVPSSPDRRFTLCRQGHPKGSTVVILLWVFHLVLHDSELFEQAQLICWTDFRVVIAGIFWVSNIIALWGIHMWLPLNSVWSGSWFGTVICRLSDAAYVGFSIRSFSVVHFQRGPRFKHFYGMCQGTTARDELTYTSVYACLVALFQHFWPRL